MPVHDLAILDHLDARAILTDDRPWIATDEGVTSEMFAALDGFKEERLALPANFAVGAEGRFKIREQLARDGDKIPLPGQLLKFFQRRRIHDGVVLPRQVGFAPHGNHWRRAGPLVS